jgi:lysophospholipid acyltransferase (LPLAT)-like uncharacterized protein
MREIHPRTSVIDVAPYDRIQSRTDTRADQKTKERVERAYAFSDLSSYTWRRRLLIRAVGLTAYALINVIGRTVRFKVEGSDHWDALTLSGRLPILAIWHNRSFLGTYFLRNRGLVVLTSKSIDGEYIARFIQRFGFGAVRGSSTRGGVGAIVEMARLMRAGGPTAFTPDGPKGPVYVAKMGPVLLAKKSGHPVLPIMVTPDRFWKANSWDGYQIPKPFTPATVKMAPPIFVPSNADASMMEAKRQELQQALDQIQP